MYRKPTRNHNDALREAVSVCCVVIVLAATAGCKTADTSAHRQEAEHGAHWGYEGGIGPADWADLSPDYALARDGKQQSPIDIRDATGTQLPAIGFHYQEQQLCITNNGHTLQQSIQEKSWIEVDGTPYGLAQFHFHTPSEHTIEGRHADMEMHMVHKDAGGNLAVVGVMINSGRENAGFLPYRNNLPAKAGETKMLDAKLNLANLLPANRKYYRYPGSLTTPPCSEGVKWLVLATPVDMSKAQLSEFAGIMGHNNRPVQPLHGRKVVVQK